MNQEMQNVASAIMYTAMMHDKKQEEIEVKAKKYDKLKEAVAEMDEWINSGNRGTCDYFIVNRIEKIISGLKTEGLI